MSEEAIFSTRSNSSERKLEEGVRPNSFAEFVGQDQIKENLSIYIQAARKRGESMDHLLLSGPPGLGKTTLSRIISTEMECDFLSVQGPSLDKVGDVAGILTSLKAGDIFFIDEIHRLRPAVEECLYSAMEDFALDVLIGEGPSARTLHMQLPQFTLIGATTREGLLTKPFRSRFGVCEKLQEYPPDHLRQIALRSAGILHVSLTEEAAIMLSQRSRGTPRLVNRFLRRLRDLAEVKSDGVIDADIAREGFRMQGVDDNGLDRTDRRILEALVRDAGRPVGVKTLATVVGESEDTIEEVYEPYLIREGYLAKTPKGRIPLKKCFQVLGLPQADEQALF